MSSLPSPEEDIRLLISRQAEEDRLERLLKEALGKCLVECVCLVSALAFTLLFPSVIITGGLGWTRGLVFFGLVSALYTMFNVVLALKLPETYTARAGKSIFSKDDQPFADKVATLVIVVSLFLMTIFAPLNALKWHWGPPIPLWMSIGGLIIYLTGVGLTYLVLLVQNLFPQRNHLAASTENREIQNPGYSFLVFSQIGFGVYFDSFPSVLMVVPLVVCIAMRVYFRLDQLEQNPDGYEERVPSRLIPFIL